MKRIIIVVFLSIIILIFPGCIMLHQGERPTDYGPGKWVSNNPDIWFEVIGTDDKLNANRLVPEGQIMLENRTIDFTMDFDGGVSVYFYNADGKSGMLFNGTCKFNPESLEVKINKKSDTVFNGKFDKIVFDRETKNISK